MKSLLAVVFVALVTVIWTAPRCDRSDIPFLQAGRIVHACR